MFLKRIERAYRIEGTVLMEFGISNPFSGATIERSATAISIEMNFLLLNI